MSQSTVKYRLPMFAIAAIAMSLVFIVLLTSCVSNQSRNEGRMTGKIPEIVIPSQAEIHSIKTANYDMTTAQAKGLVTDSTTLSEEYVYLQSVYRSGFNRWLDRDGLLSNFDAELRSDSRNFVPVTGDKLEYDQKYASCGRNYVFLLNSFFIERLSDEDLDILKTASSLDDDALEELIVRTYKDIIEVREKNGQPCYSVIYNTSVSGLWEAPADAIVLGISYTYPVDSSGHINWDIESEKEDDVNKWRDEFAKKIYEQTGTRSYVFIDNL